MDERKVFTIQKITIKLAAQDLEIDALISEHGAKRVYHESNLPEALAVHLTGEVNIEFKGERTRAQFIKETTFDGVFYNIKFVGDNVELRKSIREDVRRSGVTSPWQRKYPRISILPDLDLPMPFMAVLDFKGSSVFLQVKNFTLGGLLLDYNGDELATLTIGTVIKFDLLANNGDKISDVEATVMHISQELKEHNSEVPNYQFGVKLTSMSSLSDTKYRNIIRDFCLGVQDSKKS